MTLSEREYHAIIHDSSKVIVGEIVWEGVRHSPARKFRVDVVSEEEHPIFVNGWYNHESNKLSYAIIHRSVGRIYGLDLGAHHRNPDGVFTEGKHKNYWTTKYRDKWAYVPDDITEPWDRPLVVWEQFCNEANLRHDGTMQEPVIQGALLR